MIRAVATDIDGTFITSKARDYDRQLFSKVYKKMVAHKIRFIVASGDQYYYLRSLFPGIADQLAYVAENGALTVDRGEEVHCAQITPKNVQAIVDYLNQLANVRYIICGRKSAYDLTRFSRQFIEGARRFYLRLREIDQLAEIDDIIFKFALVVPGGQMRAIADKINRHFAGIVRATASGTGAIDLIIPGMDKSHGLQLLLDRWQLSPAELTVFGDGENDLEMFNLAGTSYAMGNAPANVQTAATRVIGTNNEQAELHELAKLLHVPL